MANFRHSNYFSFLTTCPFDLGDCHLIRLCPVEISSGDETAEEPGYRAHAFYLTAPFKLSHRPTYIHRFTSPGLQGLRPVRAQRTVRVMRGGATPAHVLPQRARSCPTVVAATLRPDSASALRAPPRGPAAGSWNCRGAGGDCSPETRLDRGGRHGAPRRLCARLQVPACPCGRRAAPRGRVAVRRAPRAPSVFGTPLWASGIFGGSPIRYARVRRPASYDLGGSVASGPEEPSVARGTPRAPVPAQFLMLWLRQRLSAHPAWGPVQDQWSFLSRWREESWESPAPGPCPRRIRASASSPIPHQLLGPNTNLNDQVLSHLQFL